MMAIDNRYDEDHVDRATSFQNGEIATSTQSIPTHNLTAHREAIYRDTHQQVYQVKQDSTEAVCRVRSHEVDRRVTEADF